MPDNTASKIWCNCITPRERELINRAEDEGLTPEIRAEIDQLRAQMGASASRTLRLVFRSVHRSVHRKPL
jgi:hypothetical protein